MSENTNGLEAQRASKPAMDKILSLMIAALCGHALASADIVFIVWLFSRVPAREMVAPYFALAAAGLVFLPFLYWARSARQAAKACAIRVVLGVNLYAQAIGIALGFAVVRLRILPRADVLDAAPFVLVLLAIGTTSGYPFVRRMLERGPSSG